MLIFNNKNSNNWLMFETYAKFQCRSHDKNSFNKNSDCIYWKCVLFFRVFLFPKKIEINMWKICIQAKKEIARMSFWGREAIVVIEKYQLPKWIEKAYFACIVLFFAYNRQFLSHTNTHNCSECAKQQPFITHNCSSRIRLCSLFVKQCFNRIFILVKA